MKYIFFLISLILFNSCVSVKVSDNTITRTSNENNSPKNIIFLIGDGMGLSHVSVGLYYKEGSSNFERFPVIGLIKTSSDSHVITDSGAAATALSSGVKTFNHAIGVNKDSIPIETVLEALSKKNMKTGIVATKSVTNATPASFFAHVSSRYDYEKIAEFLPPSNIDFVVGGGLKYFNKRKDNKNLINDILENGYTLDTLNLPRSVLENKHMILLAEKDMPFIDEGRGDFLLNATELGIEKLSQDQRNFFLMIESSLIDTAAHDLKVETMMAEQLEFDQVVGKVLDFAIKNGETLVIVTGDHETGDFALSMDGGDYGKIKPTIYSEDHSATMIPVFAYGPGSEIFSGVYENTEIYHKILSFFSESYP
jgi:alkaline phosphatase